MSPILRKKNMNPLSNRLTIRRPAATTAPKGQGTASDPDDQDLRNSMPAYVKAGTYLYKIMAEEINANTAPRIFDTYADAETILKDLRLQLMLYARQKPPFDRHSPDMTPLAFWQSLISRPDASVLAVRWTDPPIRHSYANHPNQFVQHLGVKLFSLLPNSMAEERTVSTFTKMNTADRSRQKPATLKNMAMIKQHYRRAHGEVTFPFLELWQHAAHCLSGTSGPPKSKIGPL